MLQQKTSKTKMTNGSDSDGDSDGDGDRDGNSVADLEEAAGC